MKVLFLGRIDLLEKRGGDTVQVENTAGELRNLGVEVDISTDLKCDMSKYDLVHIFQLDWIPEIYFFAKRAKEFNKKIVFSAIHHNINEVKKFDDIYAFDFRRISRVLFNDQFKRDTFKNVYRSFFDRRRLTPTFFSVIKGFKNMQRQILLWSDVILVQTDLEEKDLKETFGVDIKCVKIPNGVGKPYFNVNNVTNPLGFQDYVLCVGRIEPRKNQLSIISAVQKLRNETARDIRLVLIGAMGEVKHFEYTKLMRDKIKENLWITYLEKVPYDLMPSYYKYAKVCVSASWFETTGLTSLEALFCGTNAVAAGERAKEYLGDYASYCKPDDLESIKKAISTELSAPRPVIDEKMKSEYTWANAAATTKKVYEKVLEQEK